MQHDAAETRYVAVGDADVAYRVIGQGPLDVLHFYGVGTQIDSLWDHPSVARFLEGLAKFSRIIVFDRRGMGASDRLPRDAMPTWEEWTHDIIAVLDEVGSDRVAIVAGLDAGPIAMLFAAMHPERVEALVMSNTTARYLVDDDYPIGASSATLDFVIESVRTRWGTTDFMRVQQPADADDVEALNRSARRLRASATPSTAAAQLRYMLESLDVRAALPAIRAPTLVLHTSHNPFIPAEHGRHLAEHIEGASYREVPGHGIGFDDDQSTQAFVFEEIAAFLTGERPIVEVDRVLTTVLFTDIVRSTEQVVALGDAQWRARLDAHDRAVRAELHRFSGREVKTTGDGFCASFDGPARAIRCASAIIEAGRRLGTEIRAGIHTGECEVRHGDLAGLAVHIAARVEALAEPREVLVSGIVKDLVVGAGIEFVDRGDHDLKGVPTSVRLYAVRG
ncbi:MAG TPA: adenylate/guanylate cyclase domain-containing protein [Microthrixaceae bacterium]|nr:adenylate/guanylate cyclase domain-containing protein [Microthrixaceae bacterium]